MQVINKSHGRYHLKKTIGFSDDAQIINQLVQEAEIFITHYKAQSELFFVLGDDDIYYQSVYDNIKGVQLLGPEIILGKIFNEIGYNSKK